MDQKKQSASVRDISAAYEAEDKSALVRTQVYLAEKHRTFLAQEAKQRGVSMAVLLREWIDEKMKPESDSWEQNPLLEVTPEDPSFEGRPDGSVQSDRYVYGAVEE